VVTVPVVELGTMVDDQGFGPSVGRFRQRGETVWRELRDRGPLAANRALLKEMSRLEDALGEASVVAEVALPRVQWLQTSWLGVGNEQTLLGSDDWLFYRPAIEHVVGPGFLRTDVLEERRRSGESWESRTVPDPRPAILETRKDLAERGIELVLLPIPVKASIHPGRFSPRVDPSTAPLYNSSWDRFLAWADEAGITVFDPSPLLHTAATETGTPQFLERDTHWTPAGMERVAEALATFLEERITFEESPAGGWTRRASRVAHRGDLVEMLRLPENQKLFRDQVTTIHPVLDTRGALWRSDPDAEILLLGDSYTNVFSTADLGWGTGAGLAEQLSFRSGRAVDRIARNAGGAEGARQRLASLLDRGQDRLARKEVVVWEFSARELTHGSWQEVDLAIAPGRRPAFPESHLGDGFVVWESNRTGDWRIFTKRLDGSGLRQVTPDEPDMQHCCPHVSPDGRWIAYLSRPVGKNQYPEEEEPGPLRLVSTEDWTERTLVPLARSYGWGNRAVVWKSNNELVYIDAEGRTVERDLRGEHRRILVRERREEMGWLLDPTLRIATNAAPIFAPYDREKRRVLERQSLGGCEPYFTYDGRWGFWVAGAGGPLNRIDLETREVSTILGKNDPRLDPERRYLYFAMTSRDGRILTYGASDGDHHHFRADYDIYVAPADPETLELTGRPVRLTEHPSTDRYPDAFLDPLPLGRHRGEVPLTLRFQSPGGDDWIWTVDGRRIGRGSGVLETFRDPGVYRIEAEDPQGDRTLAGRIVADPSTPPTVEDVDLRGGGRRVVLSFSEPVLSTEGARVELDPPGLLRTWEIAEDGRSLVATLDGELQRGGRVLLHGFTDRAQEPNGLPEEWIEIAPPTWPSTREDLVFLWQTDDQPNLVFDPRIDSERAFPLEPVGRAYLDHSYTLVADGGIWLAPEEASNRIVASARARNEISVELTLEPRMSRTSELRQIMALSGRRLDLILGQKGSELVLRMQTSQQRDAPPILLGTLRKGQPLHLVLSYSPSNLIVHLDGKRVEPPRKVRGNLEPWRRAPLVLGGDRGGDRWWRGTLEGIAIWGRALTETEAREEFLRYRRILGGRPEVESRNVRVELIQKSALPTLEQISPYRKALVAYEYRILAGSDEGETLRVAHWALLDGENQPITEWPLGKRSAFHVEAFSGNPQLEPHYLSDTLDPLPPGKALWYAAGPP
ncbi:MAG: LamG-like jellyroll fold domain-containing protein, partial [Thermoanaerobaculia bacterium]|nr:LamG-like jellyroll fold domain-containing protein [Thermoanaerobaculia bacterium]